MSSKIRKCVRELERGEEIDVLLPEYAKQYMIAQDSLSRIRMMMEYYMFYEMISEGLNPYVESVRSGMGFYVSSNYIDAALLSLMSRLKHCIGLSDTCGIAKKDFKFSTFPSVCIAANRTKKLIRILSWQFHFVPPRLSLK